MNATGTPARKDGVPRENFVVTDRLNRLASLEQPLPASPRERRRGVVIRTDERAEMHEHVVTPDILGEITAAGLARPALGGDLSLDVAQNLSSLVVKAQRPRGASKSFTLNVLQQIEDR
jgi:hypothetical protein